MKLKGEVKNEIRALRMVIEHLQKEEPVPNAPGWIKDLINGITNNKE